VMRRNTAKNPSTRNELIVEAMQLALLARIRHFSRDFP
jgi:hypothetical protein